MRELSEETKAANRESAAQHYVENREKCIAYSTRWNREHRGARLVILSRRRLKKYGISQEEYFAALMKQGNKCALCGTHDPKTKHQGEWCIDHDHTSGRFRGLLCMPCNIKLGWYEKIKARIDSFDAYIRIAKLQ